MSFIVTWLYLAGKIYDKTEKILCDFFSAISITDVGLNVRRAITSSCRGVYPPQQPWRSLSPPPNVTSTPPPFPSPHSRKQFLDILYAFFAILCVFSGNFGSFQSGIMTPKIKKEYINRVGKAHCMLAFFKWRIRRNRATVASKKVFEKMIDRKII